MIPVTTHHIRHRVQSILSKKMFRQLGSPTFHPASISVSNSPFIQASSITRKPIRSHKSAWPPVPADYGSYGWHSHLFLSGFRRRSILWRNYCSPVHQHRHYRHTPFASTPPFRAVPCYLLASNFQTYGTYDSSELPSIRLPSQKQLCLQRVQIRLHQIPAARVSSPSMILFLS